MWRTDPDQTIRNHVQAAPRRRPGLTSDPTSTTSDATSRSKASTSYHAASAVTLVKRSIRSSPHPKQHPTLPDSNSHATTKICGPPHRSQWRISCTQVSRTVEGEGEQITNRPLPI